MHLPYFIILLTLKNINGYNHKGHTNNPDQVIPARYKVTASKTNYDPSMSQNLPSHFFPQVEYPESIMDSSKPFYLSSSPFPDDVKSLFKSLSEGNSKPKSPIDYSWIHNENRNEKIEEKLSLTTDKVGVNELTVTKGNEINSDDKGANETLHKEPAILDFEDDIVHYQSVEKDLDILLTNMSSVDKSNEDQEMDYVIGFVNDLDEFMKNFTSIESALEGANATSNSNGSECLIEFTSVISDKMPNNNDSIIEFNENSSRIGEHTDRVSPSLFKEPDTNDASSIFTLLFDEDITKTSFEDDMQNDFCSIGMIANQTNSSCIY